MTRSGSSRLIIFAKYPEPGKVKTRLGKRIGFLKAANAYRRLVEQTLHVARGSRVAFEVWFDPPERSRDMSAWLGRDVAYRAQPSGDLGRRMSAAFHRAFGDGCRRVVVIGTDCPDLTPVILRRAFNALHRHQVVLGPAEDGGYYLLGLSQLRPSLFRGIPWSTNRVIQATLDRIQRERLSCRWLESLRDVDHASDLKRVGRLRRGERVRKEEVPSATNQ